jgi:ArsR family transcriptional regulator, arsenate/arsenite/antimonite-responsive transcriptional repressor
MEKISRNITTMESGLPVAENGLTVEPTPTRSGAHAPKTLEITPADEDLARLTKALGHPVRVAIVRFLLQRGECVCTDLSEVVPLAHSTAMQHIKVLKDAGWLNSAKNGRNVLYCVNPEALRQLRALVGRL